MRIKELIPQWFLQIIFFTPAKLSVILLIWTTTNISGKKCHTIKNVIPHYSWRDKLSFHSEVTKEPYIMRFSIFLSFFFFFFYDEKKKSFDENFFEENLFDEKKIVWWNSFFIDLSGLMSEKLFVTHAINQSVVEI